MRAIMWPRRPLVRSTAPSSSRRSLVTSALAGTNGRLPRRRLLSTATPHSLQRSTGRQIRHISFMSAASRAIGRMGGRIVGLGAVGAGGAAYVGSQVDGLFSSLNKAYQEATNRLGDATVDAAQRLDALGQQASAGLSSLSASVQSQTTAVKGRVASLWQTARRQFGAHSEGRTEDGADDESSNQGSEGVSPSAALGAAAASQAAVFVDDNTSRASLTISDPNSALMALTRRLIEIRGLLLSIDRDDSLVLPSIVVIGSQSSGKSSVLESIVGHEFLPKGNNMVTRRPLELTLVHTPPSASQPHPKDFAECAQFGPGRFEDFGEVQRRLTRLNLDVPDSVAVEDSPLHLRIYSANVPDLSLVDLPGYVQISSIDQPEELREKIASLCDKYIRKPNIVLAVSAADVDLANSPALRASRKVDPQGHRTIGVVTKLDLVDPQLGASILANEKYKLALGYVGVVCKGPLPSAERAALWRTASRPSDRNQEEVAFFEAHAAQYHQPDLLIGMDTLKRRLMSVLERSMSESLHDISNRVSLELEEAAYQFKVQYNDRPISTDSYIAETLDGFKGRVAQFSRLFTKARVRYLIQQELDEKVQDLLAEVYWSDRRALDFSKAHNSGSSGNGGPTYWSQRVDLAQSLLAKSGIGRSATELVADELRAAMSKLASQAPFQYHPQSVERILALTDDIIEDLHARAADHVEIAVTPYRYEVDLDKRDWELARHKALGLLEKETSLCENFVSKERAELRRNWRFREAVEYMKEREESRRSSTHRQLQPDDDQHIEPSPPDDVRPPPVMLDRARRMLDLEFQLQTLKTRKAELRSRTCRSSPGNKAICPEVFLNGVAERLSFTAADFINIDLLQRFFAALPNEVNGNVYKDLEGQQGVAFARQNPEVRRHLDLQDRKQKLEKVMRELTTIAHLREGAEGGDAGEGRRRRRNYFSSLF